MCTQDRHFTEKAAYFRKLITMSTQTEKQNRGISIATVRTISF